MKNLLFVLGFILLGFTQVNAQQQRMSPEERLKNEMNRLTEELKLDKAQVDKITPIVKESMEKQSEMFRKMRESGGEVDREKMREDRQKMQEDLDKKIAANLNKEQIEKLKLLREKQQKERQERGRNR
jgi:colicin import membrane protein